MYKKILTGSKLRNKIIKGINSASNIIKITLGPKGRNVIIEKRFGSPVITKDGVTVAKEIEFKDKVENIGVQLLKEVSLKTNETSGDGTTTATVLANSIIKNGMKYIALGIDPIKIKKELSYFFNIINKRLSNKSKKIANLKEICSVGTISSNNDINIGEMISKAISKVGNDGVITIEEGKSSCDELVIVNGMQFDKGYMSPYFLKDNSRDKITLNDPYILICEDKIDNFRDIVPILEDVSKIGKPLLVIVDDLESDVLNSIVLNTIRGVLKVVVVKAPSFGEKRRNILSDISLLTKSKVINSSVGIPLKDIKVSDLGRAKRAIVLKEETIIISNKDNEENVLKRIKLLKKSIPSLETSFEVSKLRERISKLSGGIAVIKVGGNSEIEVKERKYRIEDALNATKAAIEEGILPGGGIALLRVSEWLLSKKKYSFNKIGLDIITESIKEPFIQILKNAGIEHKVVMSKINGKGNFGFDLVDNEYCDFIIKGVIDPTKVVRLALQNAISVSSLVLTIGGVITSKGRIRPEYDGVK
ncbi:chaperonin GroEL [Candidatus Vidania fulgoroideae]|uniref:60 kDa chaperonin n=1 Tax=Candidatus Vidania fulgoroideorum TaxID=881286 RepID=A0A974X7E2_9PROT|nr:chaperonin GroEL [Candidatus Vidania fulgoroideae]